MRSDTCTLQTSALASLGNGNTLILTSVSDWCPTPPNGILANWKNTACMALSLIVTAQSHSNLCYLRSSSPPLLFFLSFEDPATLTKIEFPHNLGSLFSASQLDILSHNEGSHR